MLEIFSGLRSQIKNLKDRLKALDTSKKTQKEVKEVVDALNALEERYSKERAKREEKKKLKETQNEKTPETSKETVESSKETSKPESLVKEEVKVEAIPEVIKDEIKPEPTPHITNKYNIDDKVMPVRGEKSVGRVMRHDSSDPASLVYVYWDEGPLAEKDKFGGYYSADLKKYSEEAPKPEHCPCWEDKSVYCPECKTQKTSDLKSNYIAMLQDLKDEHKEALEKRDYVWEARLKQKIEELEAKIQEMFGNEKQASGSVVLKQYGEPKRTFNSYNEALMWLHNQVDYSWDYAQKHQGWTIEENKTAEVIDHPSGTERLVTIDQTPPGDKANYNPDGGTSSSEYQDQLAMPSGSDRNLNSAKGVPNSLFDAKTAPHVAEQLKSFINAPYVNAQVSTLGGEEQVSILLTVSADPKEQWSNGILHNSRYGMFHIYNDGEIEHYSGSFNRLDEPRMNFRKRNVKNVDQLVAVINDHLAKVNAAHAEPKVSYLKTEAKNKCAVCQQEFDSWAEYDAHKKEKHSPKTSALKINVFNRDWNVEPVNKEGKFVGYDISDSDKKVMHIKPTNGKEWSEAEIKAAIHNELTRGFKQGKLTEKVAFLEKGSKVVILATSKDKKQVKFADLTNGVRGWAPSAKIKLLALEAQKVQHRGHSDPVLGESGTEILLDCVDEGPIWVSSTELLDANRPPATPESLNDLESKKKPHTEECNKANDRHVGPTEVCICNEKEALKTALPPTIPNQRGYLDNPPVDKQADQVQDAINWLTEDDAWKVKREPTKIGVQYSNEGWEWYTPEQFISFVNKGMRQTNASLNKTATVVHRSDGWHVLSEKGKNLGGPYKSKAEAVKRLRQVEYFKHHGSQKPFSKKEAEIKTTPKYWDCECEKNYIHPKSQKSCSKCHAKVEDMPDSRVSEVKKTAEVLTDPYQALTEQVSNMRSRMDAVKERLAANPLPKEAGEGEKDNSELDVPSLLEDLSMGIDLLETKLQGDEVEQDVHPAIEEMENLLWSVEEKLGITPKLSEEEKAEPEHEMETMSLEPIEDEVKKEATTTPTSPVSPSSPVSPGTATPAPAAEADKPTCALCGGLEFADFAKYQNHMEYTHASDTMPTSPSQKNLPTTVGSKKKAADVTLTDESIEDKLTNQPVTDSTNQLMPVPPVTSPQNVQPTDDDNLEIPTQMPTSVPPPGTKWTWDAVNGKFVIMTDPSLAPGKII